jgi:hypothetical protein
MNKQPEALRLAAELTTPYTEVNREAANELRRLHEVNAELLGLVKDLQEPARYWCDYDVPLGIVERINAAVKKATGETE